MLGPLGGMSMIGEFVLLDVWVGRLGWTGGVLLVVDQVNLAHPRLDPTSVLQDRARLMVLSWQVAERGDPCRCLTRRYHLPGLSAVETRYK